MTKKTILGKISVHIKGFGFVTPQDASLEDVFIPISKLGDAIDGDIVEISVTGRSPKGLEGEIVSIKKRNKNTLVGIVVYISKNGEVGLYAPSIGEERPILLQKDKTLSLQIGDRLLLEIVSPLKDSGGFVCRFKEHLGSIDEALKDTIVTIYDHQIRHIFPKEVESEAADRAQRESTGKDRRDLTDLICVTIDPEDARDYDDALSLEKTPSGEYHLGVHIADVAFFVEEGSALDEEAKARANSTYFVDRVVPMLPPILCDEYCSLKENVKRYAASALMRFSKNGDLLGYEIVRSTIKSRKRFTYEGAKEVLDGKKESPHKALLDLFVELCQLLKQQRRERGSVDLSMPEIRLIMGKDGIPVGEKRIEYDITHQLVEEFMLKANEVVAIDITKKGKAGIFRVHEKPEAETLGEFFSYARLLGFTLPKNPTEADIQQLFVHAQGSPSLEQLAVRYIRSMRLAVYSKDNIGHYGLALTYYTHFTSPIRRYSDLIVHRLLFEPKYAPDIDQIATHLSEQERKSFKAEMSLLRLKKLRYLESLIKKEPRHIFSATITKVKSSGIFFDLDQIGLEGFLHVADFGREYYDYDEKQKSFVGSNTKTSFTLGKKISVEITSINLIFQECAWHLVL